ncbi:TetR/AcrR family transcriptional regulator [Nocardioides humilatus]|uniref:TetR/AcrR family transcriptional regulator n=1 Tax=Nocardioides humilatus TaxID=2607660 RepID=A0A5B1LJP7_9ACTN|nr:TetR/AcrR family transcriptional regulator [Nocardioides humilatus]KAA1420941.1 TetR/AcrR family transcriptional regulator [Nocardioides humilatus]
MTVDPAIRSRRDELLDAAVEHVVEHGYADLSFRTLAAGLGVAHNSLTHHFGTRAQLIDAIARRMREQTQAALAIDDPELTPAGLLRAYWAQATASDRLSLWISFFEFYARALRDQQTHADYLGEVTAAWIRPIAARAEAAGLDVDRALSLATLVTGAVRGLLLDRLAASDPARVDAAFELLVDSLEAIALSVPATT